MTSAERGGVAAVAALVALLVVFGLWTGQQPTAPPATSTTTTAVAADGVPTFAGCPLLPGTWVHARVDGLPAAPLSAQWLEAVQADSAAQNGQPADPAATHLGVSAGVQRYDWGPWKAITGTATTPPVTDRSYTPGGGLTISRRRVADGTVTLRRAADLGPIWPADVVKIDAYGQAGSVDGPAPNPFAYRWQGWPFAPSWDGVVVVVDPATCVSYEYVGVAGLPAYTGVERTDGRPGSRGPLELIPPWSVYYATRIDLTSSRAPTVSNQFGTFPTGIGASATSSAADTVRIAEVAEVLRGERLDIGHATHWTLHLGSNGTFVWPSRGTDRLAGEGNNGAGAATPIDPAAPPLGSWWRLRPDYDLTALTPQARVIAEGWQRYGLVALDHGGQNAAVEATPECAGPDDLDCWQPGTIEGLNAIPLSALEAVDTTSLPATPGADVLDPRYWEIR